MLCNSFSDQEQDKMDAHSANFPTILYGATINHFVFTIKFLFEHAENYSRHTPIVRVDLKLLLSKTPGYLVTLELKNRLHLQKVWPSFLLKYHISFLILFCLLSFKCSYVLA